MLMGSRNSQVNPMRSLTPAQLISELQIGTVDLAEIQLVVSFGLPQSAIRKLGDVLFVCEESLPLDDLQAVPAEEFLTQTEADELLARCTAPPSDEVFQANLAAQVAAAQGTVIPDTRAAEAVEPDVQEEDSTGDE